MLKIITPAIVLRRQGFQEADRKIALMTTAYGKVTAYVKGVRWAKGKLASLIEPFTFLEAHLDLREDRGLATLIGGVIRNSHPRLRTQVFVWTTACTLCELTESLSPELLPNPRVFHLLGEALTTLETSPHPRLVRLAYTVQFLREIGYGLAEQLKIWNLSQGETQLLEFFDRCMFRQLSEARDLFKPPVLECVEKLLKKFLDDYLPKPLLSAEFHESLVTPR